MHFFIFSQAYAVGSVVGFTRDLNRAGSDAASCISSGELRISLCYYRPVHWLKTLSSRHRFSSPIEPSTDCGTST